MYSRNKDSVEVLRPDTIAKSSHLIKGEPDILQYYNTDLITHSDCYAPMLISIVCLQKSRSLGLVLRPIKHWTYPKKNYVTSHGHLWIPMTLLYTHKYHPFQNNVLAMLQSAFATLREITNLVLSYSKAHWHVTFCPNVSILFY